MKLLSTNASDKPLYAALGPPPMPHPNRSTRHSLTSQERTIPTSHKATQTFFKKPAAPTKSS